jgi:hypothetical protein
MGRIWTESGAIRSIRRRGFLNCFSTPERRYFVVSANPLSREGSVLLYGVGRALMLKRKLELVRGDSFAAAYRLKQPIAVTPSHEKGPAPALKPRPSRILAQRNV